MLWVFVLADLCSEEGEDIEVDDDTMEADLTIAANNRN
jgi:hypothetical protein